MSMPVCLLSSTRLAVLQAGVVNPFMRSYDRLVAARSLVSLGGCMEKPHSIV